MTASIGADHNTFIVRQQREINAKLSIFYPIQDPKPRTGAAQIQVDSSLLSEARLGTALQPSQDAYVPDDYAFKSTIVNITTTMHAVQLP